MTINIVRQPRRPDHFNITDDLAMHNVVGTVWHHTIWRGPRLRPVTRGYVATLNDGTELRSADIAGIIAKVRDALTDVHDRTRA